MGARLSFAGTLASGGEGPGSEPLPGSGRDALCSHKGGLSAPIVQMGRSRPALVTGCAYSPRYEGAEQESPRLLDPAHTPFKDGCFPQGRLSGRHPGQASTDSPTPVSPTPCQMPQEPRVPVHPGTKCSPHLQQSKLRLKEGWRPPPNLQEDLPWS